MKNILSKFVIEKYNTNAVIDKEQLNAYGKLLNNIKNIKNTHLDIFIGDNSKRKEVYIDIAKLSKNLISKIRELYTPEKVSSHRVDIKNKEKSIKLLTEAYKKVDDDILDWWKNEKKTLPSSIIHRTIDNVYKDKAFKFDENDKHFLFFLISKKFKLDLDKNTAQSTMIQHLQNIPEVVNAIDDLGISDNSSLKYDLYCLLAENIYNILLGNENSVDFSEIKKAIKEIAQRKFDTPKNGLTHASFFYPTFTLAFCKK